MSAVRRGRDPTEPNSAMFHAPNAQAAGCWSVFRVFGVKELEHCKPATSGAPGKSSPTHVADPILSRLDGCLPAVAGDGAVYASGATDRPSGLHRCRCGCGGKGGASDGPDRGSSADLEPRAGRWRSSIAAEEIVALWTSSPMNLLFCIRSLLHS
jgi:hypothetical protein